MKTLFTYLLFIVLFDFSFGQMPSTLSETEKIFTLSNLWQEVNYNFIYLNRVDRESWDNLYKELIEEVPKTKNDYEYYRLLQKFYAFLGDGHTSVNLPKAISQQITLTHGNYKFRFKNLEDKAIVVGINESKKKEIPIGSELIKVNGLKTQNYLDKYVKPYIASSTDYILASTAIYHVLKAPIGTKFEVELKLPNGSIKKLNLTNSKNNKESMFPPAEETVLFEFKWLKNNIAYIALNSFQDEEINTLFEDKLPELYKAGKLIVDLRKNGGGRTDIGLNILKYLSNDTLFYGPKSSSRLHIPSYKAWGKFLQARDTINDEHAKKSYLSYHDELYHYFPYGPRALRTEHKRIVIPTVILIGNYTGSAAEDFLIYADKLKNITKIGEPTYGSTGQPLFFDIAGGGSARICTKKDTYPDGKEFVGYGIQPDIYVTKSISHYLNNEDPALEKALEYLKKH